MMGKLLRAAGGAASFTLGSLWPMRWPAFPVAFLDFDMFNGVADAHWDRAKARCAERAQQTSAAETECPATSASADPSVVDGPALGSLPPGAGAGHPNLTVGELEDAAYAVRRHIDRLTSEIGAEAWTHLAEKLEAAAVSK
ncbi:hypothetical protein [Mycobacterium paragordonae]|uniref:hypothetical protein n=1 Tax=Mycobacterium paragordonae TaxID=1389713 RepID=UPI001060AF0C|nr:hypothetical protein [Mycobacterium paragordonae]TDL05993.1 hypothetical protein EUA05_16775 [Mycobacterium paragordonae]